MKFSCPRCGKHLEAEPELCGKEVECPSCAAPLSVPTAEEEETDTPPQKPDPPAPCATVAPPTSSTEAAEEVSSAAVGQVRIGRLIVGILAGLYALGQLIQIVVRLAGAGGTYQGLAFVSAGLIFFALALGLSIKMFRSAFPKPGTITGVHPADKDPQPAAPEARVAQPPIQQHGVSAGRVVGYLFVSLTAFVLLVVQMVAIQSFVQIRVGMDHPMGTGLEVIGIAFTMLSLPLGFLIGFAVLPPRRPRKDRRDWSFAYMGCIVAIVLECIVSVVIPSAAPASASAYPVALGLCWVCGFALALILWPPKLRTTDSLSADPETTNLSNKGSKKNAGEETR